MLVSDHLAHLRRRNLRPSTIYQRQRTLARLGDVDLLWLSTEDLALHLDARDLTPGSRRTEIMHLHGFYEWAVKEGLVDRDPTEGLERPFWHSQGTSGSLVSCQYSTTALPLHLATRLTVHVYCRYAN